MKRKNWTLLKYNKTQQTNSIISLIGAESFKRKN